MKYKIADIIVDFDVLHPHLGNQITDYVYDGNEKTNLHLRVTDQFYEELRKYYPNLSDDTLEYIYLGGEFYSTLVHFNGMMLHSSCVVYNNRAYLFSAPSGTGKSTHTQLWLKRFPGSYILNDDKPAIRLSKDGIFVYGTPFSGKTNLQQNKRVPIGGICVLERAETNSITRVSTEDAIFALLNQTIRPYKEDELDKIMNTIDILVRKVPVYRLKCNMETEAAEVAYNGMKGSTDNEN